MAVVETRRLLAYSLKARRFLNPVSSSLSCRVCGVYPATKYPPTNYSPPKYPRTYMAFYPSAHGPVAFCPQTYCIFIAMKFVTN